MQISRCPEGAEEVPFYMYPGPQPSIGPLVVARIGGHSIEVTPTSALFSRERRLGPRPGYTESGLTCVPESLARKVTRYDTLWEKRQMFSQAYGRATGAIQARAGALGVQGIIAGDGTGAVDGELVRAPHWGGTDYLFVPGRQTAIEWSARYLRTGWGDQAEVRVLEPDVRDIAFEESFRHTGPPVVLNVSVPADLAREMAAADEAYARQAEIREAMERVRRKIEKQASEAIGIILA